MFRKGKQLFLQHHMQLLFTSTHTDQDDLHIGIVR